MKIGCDACGRAEAAVLCCADEAALCRRCDAAVHSANKLAGRHHRVALLPSTPAQPNVVGGDGGHHPACDICQKENAQLAAGFNLVTGGNGAHIQVEDLARLVLAASTIKRSCLEKTGYFFCLEDRALLCRPCDVAIHAASVHASAHRRFLITGVRVGDVQSGHHHHGDVPCKDSPSSSANSGFPSSSSDPTSVSGNLRSSPAAEDKAAEEGLAQERWLWSEIFADGGGM